MVMLGTHDAAAGHVLRLYCEARYRAAAELYAASAVVGCDQLQAWEVRPVARSVTCQQPVTSDSGVGTDVEVGQRRAPRASRCSVAPERLARQEGCLEGEVLTAVQVVWQGLLQ